MRSDRSSIKRTILRWLPAALWMALIFWLSAQPDLPRPENDLFNLVLRKGAHFGAYGTLALFYLFGLGDLRRGSSRRWIALGLAALYAASDELHQSWTPTRQPTVMDVLIDTAGAATALWLWNRFGDAVIARTARSWAGDRAPASDETRA